MENLENLLGRKLTKTEKMLAETYQKDERYEAVKDSNGNLMYKLV